MDVLVINCGSSSIKYQLFDMENEKVLARGIVEKIGEEISAFKQETEKGTVTFEMKVPGHEEGMQIIAEQLMHEENGVISGPEEISAVGHRVVEAQPLAFHGQLADIGSSQQQKILGDSFQDEMFLQCPRRRRLASQQRRLSG